MDMLFPEVLQAEAGEEYNVLAYMNDGTVRKFDVWPLIEKGGVFAPLADRETFVNTLTVLNHSVAWDLSGRRDPADCIDLDPFTLSAQPKLLSD